MSVTRLQHISASAFSILVLTLASLAWPATVLASVDKINNEIDNCTRQHGYNPRQPNNLGANQLGNNERSFLECVYAGIESNLIPRAMFPEDYKYLIKRHKEMTDAVEKGELTRRQRQAETRQIMDIIKDKEMRETNKRIDELSGKREWLLQQRSSMLKRSPIPF